MCSAEAGHPDRVHRGRWISIEPEVIIPRKSVEKGIILIGLTPEKATTRSQPHGFIDTRIFDSSFGETFIPELLRRRAVHGYQGPAVLLLDNCSADNGPRFHGLCGIHRVVPCYFPRRSSNRLQPLDLSLFGITKRPLSRVNKLDAVNIQTKHVASVVCAFLAAAVPWNVVKTFKVSGICLVADDGVLRCSVTPEMAKGLNQPLPSAVPEMADRGSDDSDVEELEVPVGECAGLLYDLAEESPE
jgi:hypothetical protein